MMKEFDELVKVLERLLGPQGCPWDKDQTLNSLRSSVLEETSELIEAINLNDNAHIQEELGDLFFNVIFLCKVAEKEKRFEMASVLKEVTEKLIRRHPHVFGDAVVKNLEGHLKQWDQIKAKEQSKTHRKSALDGIPKDLSSLARTEKCLKQMHKNDFKDIPQRKISDKFDDEESLGEILLHLVDKARLRGLDAEHALRKTLTHLERDFHNFEKNGKI
jgi:tetrapyrrole methylase family protein/MazG family protein